MPHDDDRTLSMLSSEVASNNLRQSVPDAFTVNGSDDEDDYDQETDDKQKGFMINGRRILKPQRMVSVNSELMRGPGHSIDKSNMNSFAGYRDTVTGKQHNSGGDPDNFEMEMHDAYPDDI